MEIIKTTAQEKDPQPRDVSAEFAQMSSTDFFDFLRTLENEPNLSIVADWEDEWRARLLKAFVEAPSPGQKREASIRATKEERDREKNVFASGVKWIRVEK